LELRKKEENIKDDYLSFEMSLDEDNFRSTSKNLEKHKQAILKEIKKNYE